MKTNFKKMIDLAVQKTTQELKLPIDLITLNTNEENFNSNLASYLDEENLIIYLNLKWLYKVEELDGFILMCKELRKCYQVLQMKLLKEMHKVDEELEVITSWSKENNRNIDSDAFSNYMLKKYFDITLESSEEIKIREQQIKNKLS